MGKNLVILFPGGRGTETPLLYFCSKVFENMDYDRHFLQHPLDGSTDYDSLLKNATEYFETLDIEEYQSIVFVAKSLGTVVAGAIKEKYSIPAALVFLTPLEETFSYIRKDNCVLLVAMGSNDRYISYETVRQKCEQEEVSFYLEPGIGHRMEVKGDIHRDLEVIKNVVSRLTSCLSGDFSR